MYNDYDYENFYEPTTAEEIMQEAVNKFMDAAKDEVKAYYDKILDENQILKAKNDDLQKQVDGIATKERELKYEKENMLRTVRKERLGELMKDFQVVYYHYDTKTVKPPKCDKCDAERYIHFTSPSGKDMKEKCSCDKGKIVHIPKEYIATEFRVNNYSSDKNYNKTIIAWYKLNTSDDHDYYSYSGNVPECIYEDGMDMSKLNKYGTYFKTVEDCQKYCDYLNANAKDED